MKPLFALLISAAALHASAISSVSAVVQANPPNPNASLSCSQTGASNVFLSCDLLSPDNLGSSLARAFANDNTLSVTAGAGSASPLWSASANAKASFDDLVSFAQAGTINSLWQIYFQTVSENVPGSFEAMGTYVPLWTPGQIKIPFAYGGGTIDFSASLQSAASGPGDQFASVTAQFLGFDVPPIPEPAPGFLIAIGSIVLLFLRRAGWIRRT